MNNKIDTSPTLSNKFGSKRVWSFEQAASRSVSWIRTGLLLGITKASSAGSQS